MATSLEPAVQLDRRRRFSLLFCCCCCFSFCPSRTLDGAAGGGGGRGVGGVADRRLFSSGRSSTAWMQLRFCFKFLDPIWSFFLQGLVWTQHFSGCVTEPSTGRMWSLCHVQILFWGSIFWFKKFQNKVIIRFKKNWSFAEALVNRFNRRKSVFAESYDPEGDDDEGEKVSSASMSLLLFIFCVILWSSVPQVLYPKSDLQRHRLSEAVKNILLFRSLDPVSCVSDSLFIKKKLRNLAGK